MELDEDWRAVHHAEMAYSRDHAFALTYARALFNYGELDKCKDTIQENLDQAPEGDDKGDCSGSLLFKARVRIPAWAFCCSQIYDPSLRTFNEYLRSLRRT